MKTSYRQTHTHIKHRSALYKLSEPRRMPGLVLEALG